MQRRGWSKAGIDTSTLLRASLAGPVEIVLGYFCGQFCGIRKYQIDGEPLHADWADVDHRGRLLLAREGRILVHDGREERELIDLSPYEFRPLAPPEWATEWPK